MNACVNTYEMGMPAHYVDMNGNEMEYDGGQSRWEFGIDIGVTVGGFLVGLMFWPVGLATAAYSVADQACHYYGYNDGFIEYLSRLELADASYPTSIPITERTKPSRAYYP